MPEKPLRAPTKRPAPISQKLFIFAAFCSCAKSMMDIDKRRVIGYAAGIAAGISYGTNPLFAKPLMESGVPVMVMLFFRYGLSACILAIWMLLRKESFRAGKRSSYAFIPSGLATTLVYLYPVFVALIMVLLRFYPSWQTWLSILATFGGIALLSQPAAGAGIRISGIILAVLSALSYAFYLVIVNRSKRIKHISEHTLTLAISSRYIGPTRTSVLGVFEPLTAILIGTILFGEPLSLKMASGILICVAAVVFMILKPGRKS